MFARRYLDTVAERERGEAQRVGDGPPETWLRKCRKVVPTHLCGVGPGRNHMAVKGRGQVGRLAHSSVGLSGAG